MLANSRYLIIADFASEYGIRLHKIGNRLPWAEFHDLLYGLLSADSRLARRYAPKKPQQEPTPEPEGGDD